MPPTEPTIANYDAQSADEITQRLRKLSQADLTKLETSERQGQARATVLERIAALRGETPWPGYDEMEVEQVNDALKQRDADAARRVLDYERRHKARTTIIEFAERRRAEGEAKASSKPAAQPKRNARKSAAAKPASRSTAKQASRSTAKPASRSTARRSGAATRSSGQRSSSSGRSTRPATSRTRAKSAARPAARSSAGSRKTAPPSVGKRITGAVRSTGARSEQVAKGAGHAVGTAAKKAKVPALATGAIAAALGGGLVLGSKLLPKHGLRRSRLSQASKSVGKARKGIVEAGDRVDAIAKQVSAVNREIQRIAGGSVRD